MEHYQLFSLLRNSTLSEPLRSDIEDRIENIEAEDEYKKIYYLLESHQLTIRDGIYYGTNDILKFLEFRFGKDERRFKFI
jgi:hypothetical protein